MTVSAQPAVTHDAPTSVAVADTHASTEAAHGEGGGGLPQFEFQHWFGQIVYLIFLFALLYWLMAKVFVPRLRGVIDQRAATIADAVQTARQVPAYTAGQAAAPQARGGAAGPGPGLPAARARPRVPAPATAGAAGEEAVVKARIAEAETAIGKTRDAAMTNVASIASDTAAAIVERLTGKAPTAAEAAAAVKGAA